MNPDVVGARLRELRENHPTKGHLSREGAGRMINVSSKTIERWEKGELGDLLRDPGLVDAVAAAYEADLDRLLPRYSRGEIEEPLREQLERIEGLLQELLSRVPAVEPGADDDHPEDDAPPSSLTG